MLTNDQIRILSSMVFCIPLSYIIPKIPSQLREIYSLLMGSLIQYYIYGNQIFVTFALHILMYFLIKINPKHSGKKVTLISLALLSVYHIYRMITDYGNWSIDISTIMMSNVNKYSFFAYSYQDGHTPQQKLTKQQIKQKFIQLPSLFKFLGYCQFLPCSPISIAFPYKYFQDYMALRNQYARIPSPWKNVGIDVGYSLILALFYVANILYFPLDQMKSPQFAQQNFWYIIYFSFFCVTTLRFKYYFAWKLSMGAIHASGVSYQQHADKTSDFKLIQSCNPQIVETTVHTRQKVANWNMTCQQWLRKCIYQRYNFKNKMYGQLLTFIISAFWHGFYGGYYLSFILWFAQVYVSQLVFKQSKKQNSKFVKLYKSLGIIGEMILWVLSNVTFTVSGLFFQILSLKQGILILKTIYFAPFLAYALVYVVFTFGATREKKPKSSDFKNHQDKKQQKKANHQDNTTHDIAQIKQNTPQQVKTGAVPQYKVD